MSRARPVVIRIFGKMIKREIIMGEVAKQSKKNKKKKVSKRVNLTTLVFIFLVVILGLLGISKFISERGLLKKADSKLVESQLDLHEGNLEGGTSMEAEKVSLPQDFPTDFPVYPEARLTSAHKTKGSSIDGMSLTWFTNDAEEDVSEFYIKEFGEIGYIIVEQMNEESSTTFSFEKSNITGFVGITKGEESQTIILVTLGISKE